MKFIVEGIPQGKARPRFSRGHAYTPEKTREYEQRVAWEYKRAGGKLHDGVVWVSVKACMKIPGSFGKKKQAAMEGTYHTKKPDVDNILKAVLDGLNGVAYQDDSCVMIGYAEKIYSKTPRLEVEVADD